MMYSSKMTYAPIGKRSVLLAAIVAAPTTECRGCFFIAGHLDQQPGWTVDGECGYANRCGCRNSTDPV